MRRVLFTALSFIAITATTALAADLPRGMPPTKAPAFVPGFSWTGFYVGINGGYGWGTSSWDGFGNDTDINGGLVGGTVGYNWQTGPFGVRPRGRHRLDPHPRHLHQRSVSRWLRNPKQLARHRARTGRLCV